MNLLETTCLTLTTFGILEILLNNALKSLSSNILRFMKNRLGIVSKFLFSVRQQAEIRRKRLQEAATVHQFIRDLEEEEAQIK